MRDSKRDATRTCRDSSRLLQTQPMGERLWSNSFIPLHRWTHLAAVAEGHSLRLYINGLLDSENTTVGTILQNTGPLFLGGGAFPSPCRLPARQPHLHHPVPHMSSDLGAHTCVPFQTLGGQRVASMATWMR